MIRLWLRLHSQSAYFRCQCISSNILNGQCRAARVLVAHYSTAVKQGEDQMHNESVSTCPTDMDACDQPALGFTTSCQNQYTPKYEEVKLRKQPSIAKEALRQRLPLTLPSENQQTSRSLYRSRHKPSWVPSLSCPCPDDLTSQT
jgi:hypothetical protein